MASKKDEYNYLPDGLPEPADDGACDHLVGIELPSIELPSTEGRIINLAKQESEYVVVFCYPMTGSPTNELLWKYSEEWNNTPGACGCTTQVCSFRDRISEFEKFDCEVFGLSNNSTDYQKEAAERLEIEFELLSDENMEFARALKLPTIEFHGLTLIKRLTIVARNNVIEKVFYPIFPPNTDAENVIGWLKENRSPV